MRACKSWGNYHMMYRSTCATICSKSVTRILHDSCRASFRDLNFPRSCHRHRPKFPPAFYISFIRVVPSVLPSPPGRSMNQFSLFLFQRTLTSLLHIFFFLSVTLFSFFFFHIFEIIVQDISYKSDTFCR